MQCCRSFELCVVSVCLLMKLVDVLVSGNVLLFLSLPCCSDKRELVFVTIFCLSVALCCSYCFCEFPLSDCNFSWNHLDNVINFF